MNPIRRVLVKTTLFLTNCRRGLNCRPYILTENDLITVVSAITFSQLPLLFLQVCCFDTVK